MIALWVDIKVLEKQCDEILVVVVVGYVSCLATKTASRKCPWRLLVLIPNNHEKKGHALEL